MDDTYSFSWVPWEPKDGGCYDVEFLGFRNIDYGTYILKSCRLRFVDEINVLCLYPCLISKFEAVCKKNPGIKHFFARILYTGKNNNGDLLFKVWIDEGN